MRILEEKSQNFSKDDIKTEELEEDNIPSFKLIPKNEIALNAIFNLTHL